MNNNRNKIRIYTRNIISINKIFNYNNLNLTFRRGRCIEDATCL